MADKRLALVTGAARGIGRAVVMELLAQGRKVAGIDLNEDALKELQETAENDGEIITRKVDITNTDELSETVDWLAS